MWVAWNVFWVLMRCAALVGLIYGLEVLAVGVPVGDLLGFAV